MRFDGGAARNISISSSLLPFFGTRLRRENFNLAPTKYRQLRRLEATGYSEFRDYQRKTIEAYLSGKDFFVSAPTGAGKSLTFELAPYTFDHFFGEACNTIVFVIVPLISLMKDQVSNLNSRGIRASYVGDDCSEEQVEDILNLKEKIVFGSPEAILNNYRHIFRHLKRNMKCVFIDESHCIAKW